MQFPHGGVSLQHLIDRAEAFVRGGIRRRFYQSDDPTIAQLVDDKDETLFAAVLHNELVLPKVIWGERVATPRRRMHSPTACASCSLYNA